LTDLLPAMDPVAEFVDTTPSIVGRLDLESQLSARQRTAKQVRLLTVVSQFLAK
jgi:hypothetical protein